MVWFVLKYFSVEVIQVEFSDPVAASDVKRYRRFAGADSQVIWWAAPTGKVRVNGASGASGIPAGGIQPNQTSGDVRNAAVFPLFAAQRRQPTGNRVLAGAPAVDYVDAAGLI